MKVPGINELTEKQQECVNYPMDKDVLVRGIAGSGKTTVALHRIAFLLYRLENLTSNNILIFSPNNIFTEYISDVLPSLGESNTLQTTFNDYLSYFITEYQNIETFTDFVSRYYSYKEENPELVEYKQSDEIIADLDAYLADYISNCKFTEDVIENEFNVVLKEELNEMLTYKYDRFPLFDRIHEIATKISENNYSGSSKNTSSIEKILKENLNTKLDLKYIINDFYNSRYSKYKSEVKENNLYYEDACIINNQLCDYPTKSLSGAGVVYKLCSYLDNILGVNNAD